MNFTEPRFQLRMRSGWEAADFGVLIWRRKAFLLLLAVLIPAALVLSLLSILAMALTPSRPSGPAAGIVSLLVSPFPFQNHIFFMIAFAHIWLKPLYDRFALQVCAKIFFEKTTGAKELLKGLGATITRGLAGDLLWRRFSPFRGVRLPLRVLERPSRGQYAQRKEVLSRGGSDFGMFLTAFCLVLEYALNIGSIVFIVLAAQLAGIDQNFFELGVTGIGATLLRLINFALTETLYIAMSFAVYINSRVVTEGWDLQLMFRQMAEKIPVFNPARQKVLNNEIQTKEPLAKL